MAYSFSLQRHSVYFHVFKTTLTYVQMKTVTYKIDLKIANTILFETLNLFKCHKLFIEYETRSR